MERVGQDNLISNVQQLLVRFGWVHLRAPMTRSEFEHIASSLGQIVARDEIRLGDTGRKLHSPAAMELHTDSFVSDINAWHCVETGNPVQATRLIDASLAVSQLEPEDRRALCRVTMDCPNRSHDRFHCKPLLSTRGEQLFIFYTPWFLHEPPDDQSRRALDRFQQLIERENSTNDINVALESGEALFIDNKRMLHGRDALRPGTRRHLSRVWIATGPVEEELLM